MENFKKVVKELCDVGEVTEKALEDGKISLIEGLSIGKETLDLAFVYKKIPLAIDEYKNASQEQKQEAGQFIKDELDLVNDNIELIAETAFTMLIEALTVFSKKKLEA